MLLPLVASSWGYLNPFSDLQLTTPNAHHVGYRQTVTLPHDARHMSPDGDLMSPDITIVTRSMSPLVFQVDDFLTHWECNQIIRAAKAKGMEESSTMPTMGNQIIDPDNDGQLTAGEFRLTLEQSHSISFSAKQARSLLRRLKTKPGNPPAIVSVAEWQGVPTSKKRKVINKLLKKW
jgi:hypothetical protein